MDKKKRARKLRKNIVTVEVSTIADELEKASLVRPESEGTDLDFEYNKTDMQELISLGF